MALQITSLCASILAVAAITPACRRPGFIGVLLLISRAAHVYGLRNESPTEHFRIAGIIGSLLAIAGASASRLSTGMKFFRIACRSEESGSSS